MTKMLRWTLGGLWVLCILGSLVCWATWWPWFTLGVVAVMAAILLLAVVWEWWWADYPEYTFLGRSIGGASED